MFQFVHKRGPEGEECVSDESREKQTDRGGFDVSSALRIERLGGKKKQYHRTNVSLQTTSRGVCRIFFVRGWCYDSQMAHAHSFMRADVNH